MLAFSKKAFSPHPMNLRPPRPTDADPTETREWLEALQAAVQRGGRERGLFLIEQLEEQAQQMGIVPHVLPYSAYRNTLPVDQQGRYPGDLEIEQRLTVIMRWNALAMVMRANQAYGDLGGHIASYASAAEIFERTRQANRSNKLTAATMKVLMMRL